MNYSKINIKTIARIATIQLLYQYNNYEKNIDTLIQRMLNYYESLKTEQHEVKIKLNVNYFKLLTNKTITNIDLVKENITNLLEKNQSINYVPDLALAIVMVGTTELIFMPEVPFKVVINEYSDIAGQMVSEVEVSFINSILDKIAKKRAINI